MSDVGFLPAMDFGYRNVQSSAEVSGGIEEGDPLQIRPEF